MFTLLKTSEIVYTIFFNLSIQMEINNGYNLQQITWTKSSPKRIQLHFWRIHNQAAYPVASDPIFVVVRY